jgi:hypothetical protein
VIHSGRLRWSGHVARMEESRSAFKILTDKPTRKRPLGRRILRWNDKEICISMRNLVDSAQDKDYWRALANCDVESLSSKSYRVN